MPLTQQPTKIDVNPATLPNLFCPHCYGPWWTPLMVIKRVSALQAPIPVGMRGAIPIPIGDQFVCMNCLERVMTDNMLEEEDVRKAKQAKEERGNGDSGAEKQEETTTMPKVL